MLPFLHSPPPGNGGGCGKRNRPHWLPISPLAVRLRPHQSTGIPKTPLFPLHWRGRANGHQGSKQEELEGRKGMYPSLGGERRRGKHFIFRIIKSHYTAM